MRHARLSAVGAYRPRRVVSNAEICTRIDSTEEWIESRSGIRSRRFAAPDETLPAMAEAAAGAALTEAGVAPERIGAVVLASMSNLVQTPPLAATVAHRVGAVAAGAFDLSGACAGFCHALAVAGDMVRAGSAEHVLVVAVERMTDIVDPADRSIAFLFADGAGAVMVGPSDRPGLGPVVRGAHGDMAAALRMTGSWADFRADPSGLPPVMRMDGRRIFRWAVDEVAPAAQRALDLAGVRPENLAAFVPHQANTRIIDLMVQRLELPDSVAVARDLVTAGNTSAASIPLALHGLRDAGAARSGEPALLVGFGAGLTYAAQVVLLP
ncbi:beta-ketoacyl-ACP synthase 3 [Micromonospora sp. BRA006-A]|nr:beta-ketoacyl-ACP synthase 3 [Micromonospora sp. BRA006-A]